MSTRTIHQRLKDSFILNLLAGYFNLLLISVYTKGDWPLPGP